MKHWHVIQVIGGSEEKVLHKIQSEDYHAFIPKRIKVMRKHGSIRKVEEPLFRGYVFIETDKTYQSFRYYLDNNIRLVEGFIRLLKHNNEGLETILPHERAFIEKFSDANKTIQPSIGFIEGDTVVVTEGPLFGHESMIKRIDRHKRTAELEMTLFSEIQRIIISLEILHRLP